MRFSSSILLHWNMCSEKKTYKLYSSSPLYQPAVFHFILVMFLSEWFWLLLVIDTIRQVGGRSPVLSWTRNLGKQNEAGLPCGLAGYLFKNVLHVLSFLVMRMRVDQDIKKMESVNRWRCLRPGGCRTATCHGKHPLLTYGYLNMSAEASLPICLFLADLALVTPKGWRRR